MAAQISLAAAKKAKKNGKPPVEETEDEPCPITPLGHADGKFWFLNIYGEKRCLSARQLGSRPEIAGLFVGRTEWLQGKKRFAAVDAEGNSRGWSVARVGEFLMDECGKTGIYGDHVVIRRAGVWPGEYGQVIAHCGDALFIDGEKHPPGTKFAGQIFAAGAREIYPSAKPAGREVAQGFLGDIRNWWNLQHDGGEIIALGLVGQSYFAAALSWRSNGFISGGTNAGKSFLLDFLRAMVPMHHYSNDTSKAGIEGAIAGRAMPSFIDESFDRQGAQTLLDVVLSASSGVGTKGHRGTADGGVRGIEIVGSAIMASINPPAMQPQHRSRFAVIELLRPASGVDHKPQMTAAIARAKDAAPALFARALAGFERFGLALRAFRTALGLAGCVAREMDQLGAILAGHWVLAEDGVPTADDATEMVKMISEFVVGAEEMLRDSAPQAVLSMLLSKIVNLERSTDQESIGGLVRMVFRRMVIPQDDHQRETAVKVLRRWGLRPIRADQVYEDSKQSRIIPRLSTGNGLWVDERCEPLKGIFAGSPYESGRWIVELRRLPGSWKSQNNVRVGDLPPARAIWISWDDVDQFDDSG